MNTQVESRTLWVDTDRFALYREGASLMLQAYGRAATRVPLARVGRAVIRGSNHSAALLDACLALAASGAVVHFPAAGDRPTLRLQPEPTSATGPVAELAALIDRGGLGPFHWWADVQRRHAWSTIFRRGFRGDFDAARKRLQDYLRHIGTGHCFFPDEIDALEANLRQWLAAELHRRGWEPVAHALSSRGARLETVLHQCLYIPLLWRFTGWRRQQLPDLHERERVHFFELESAGRLAGQLHRHLRALADEYHASWRRQVLLEESDDG